MGMVMPDKKYRILVVDDEQTIANMLADVFAFEGYEAATAFSGEQAIVVARSFKPDFLVSDVVMGGMNGIEAAINILSTLPQCKVLFVSGNAMYTDTPGSSSLKQAYAKGFHFEMIQKPVRARELLDRISQILLLESESHHPMQSM
jgi:CheY-like chemotaxis protein